MYYFVIFHQTLCKHKSLYLKKKKLINKLINIVSFIKCIVPLIFLLSLSNKKMHLSEIKRYISKVLNLLFCLS